MEAKCLKIQSTLISMALNHNLLFRFSIIYRRLSSNNFTGELPATLATLTTLQDL